MKFILSFIEKTKNRIAQADKVPAQTNSDAQLLVTGDFDSRNESNSEAVIDFSNAATIETPELTEDAAPWDENPQLYEKSSEWLALTVKAQAAYSRKKYAVARDLFNEANHISPLDYRSRPILFRTLRKLTDPKLVRRLPSLK